MSDNEQIRQVLAHREMLLREARTEASHSMTMSRIFQLMNQSDNLESGILNAIDLCKQESKADAWLLLKESPNGKIIHSGSDPEFFGTQIADPTSFLEQPRNVISLRDTRLFGSLPESFPCYNSLLSEPIRDSFEALLVVVLLSKKRSAFTQFDKTLLRSAGEIIQQTINDKRYAHQNSILPSVLSSYCIYPPPASLVLDTSFEALSRAYARIAEWQNKIVRTTNDLLRSPIDDCVAAVTVALFETSRLIDADFAIFELLDESDEINLPIAWASDDQITFKQALIDFFAKSVLVDDIVRIYYRNSSEDLALVINLSELDQGSHLHSFFKKFDVQSIVAIIIFDESNIKGVLCFGLCKENISFLPIEIQLLQAVGNAVAVVADRAKTDARANASRAELIRERNRLHSTLAAIPDLVIELDHEGRFIGYVAGDRMQLVYPFESLIGSSPEEVLPSELSILVRELIDIVSREKRTEGHEFQAKIFGQDRLFVVSAATTRIDDVATGYVLLVRDITHRAQQRRSLRRLGKIAELTSNLVLITDKNARIEWVNQSFERQSGWKLAEIQGGSIMNYIFAPGQSTKINSRIDAAFKECRPLRLEISNKKRNGDVYWVSADIQPLVDDEGLLEGFVVVQTDITDLKESQQSVVRDRAKALDASLDGIAITDSAGRYKYMNAAHRRMFGISDAADVSCIHWNELYPPAQLDQFMSEQWPILNETGHWRGELTGLDKFGTPVPQEVSLTIHDQGILCISRNISNRLRLESERTHLREELQMAQRRDTIAHLASGVAHDLNNLVAVVAGSASLLREMCVDNIEAKAGINRILRATDTARDLVNGLGYLGRPKAARQHHELGALLREGRELLGTQRIKNNDVAAIVPATPCFIWGNVTEILQVIMNLALNACDATDDRPNKVRLLVEDSSLMPNRSPEIGVVLPRLDYVMFSISDTGGGIDEETRRRLFDRYFSTKQKSGGGLGLPIVAGILRDNHAALWIDSEVGHGTKVTVSWPSEHLIQESNQTTAFKHSQHEDLSGYNLLVVDDLPDVADILAEMLESAGATTIVVSNAVDAQAILEDNPGIWSALVTDLDMPGKTGIDLANIARNCEPPIPSVLVTALPEALGGMSGLFHAVLSKPVEARQLVSAVCAAILKSDK